MKNDNQIYKGKQLVEYQLNLMKKLIGEEVKPKQKILIPHKGADGSVYGIVREGHYYFIKVGDINNDGKVLEESFNYIGGLQNKDEKFKSYEAATKRLNGKLLSLNEAYNNQDKFNPVRGDVKIDEPEIEDDSNVEVLVDELRPSYLDEVEELLSDGAEQVYSLPMVYDSLRGENPNSWKIINDKLVNTGDNNLVLPLTPALEGELEPVSFDLNQFNFDDSDEISSRKIEYGVEEPLEEEADSFMDSEEFRPTQEFLTQYLKDKEKSVNIDMSDITHNNPEFDNGEDVNISDFNPDTKYVKPDFDDDYSEEVLQQQKLKEKERQERLTRKEDFINGWKKDYKKDYNDNWWAENETERDPERQREYNANQKNYRKEFYRKQKEGKINDSVEDMINLIIEERFSKLKKK